MSAQCGRLQERDVVDGEKKIGRKGEGLHCEVASPKEEHALGHVP